jgi:D-3-phosphoglycerate dehydrogenase / 2-oxoglutarate reductase
VRVLHLEAEHYPQNALQELNTKFELVINSCISQQQLHAYLSVEKFDIIFTKLGLMIDKSMIMLQPNLKYIVTPTTGLNHIDIITAEIAGITIISLKGEELFLSTIKSTAEHTWALLLALTRRLNGSFQAVKDGNWDRQPFLCDELDGKILGIIGFGRLGKIIARYAEAFGMTVLVHDRNPKQYEFNKFVTPLSLNNLLAKSDVIFLMLSWSKENDRFMNENLFKLMKRGSYFVNTSRGELVDEKALLQFLQNNHLKGVALDVLENDSAWDMKVQGSQALIQYAKVHANLLITPHIGGFGKESIYRTRNFITQKLIKIIQQ